MFALKIRENFEAAHRLPGYPGKCNRLHGHNWQVEVEIVGEKLDKLGMLVDFVVVKQTLKNILDEFDHLYLNELPPFDGGLNPTAENLAKLIFSRLEASDIFPPNVELSAVTVWESEHSCVTYAP